MRLDPAEVAMTYWLGGAVLNRQRTEFQGIDRLLSPQIYRIPANSTALAELGTYYAPPPCLPEQAFANSTRAAEDLIAALQPPLQGLSERTALAFSAGHDSGLMYILARTRPELGLRPPLYGMTHPGSMNDERPGMEALASHFGDAVRFVDAPKVSFEEAMELNLRTADGIVPVSTVAGGVKLARRLVADGGTHCLTGMGAEAALQVFPTYLLDLLRQGRVVAFLRDALRFRPYLTGGAGLPHRLRHLARALLAPKDSVLGRARERRRVGAAGERWQAMLAEGLDAFISIRRDETYGRTVRLMQLRFHSLMSGTEQAEQLFESHGVSLVQPYAHRQVMDVGLRIPARTLSGGRYDKYLQRSAATLLLGHDPGWPWHKTSAAAVNEPISGASIEALGPPPGWRLVELEILTLEAAREITRNPGTWAALSHLLNHESYLRHYGA
jgi:asparagine synthetase B (glutamine-hydrolysing)